MFDLLPYLPHLLAAHEQGSASSLPSVAQVVVRAVLLWVVGIFATTVGFAANIVLLG